MATCPLPSAADLCAADWLPPESPFWTPETRALLGLPPRFGGIGVTRTHDIREAAYLGSLDESRAPAPGLDQASRAAAIHKATAQAVDRLGPIPKAHRSACTSTLTSLWFGSPAGWSDDRCFTAALRTRVALPPEHTRMTTQCPGCARNFDTARALTAHLSGCARLSTWNAATTHHAANAALQRLARRCLVETTNEPRFHTYTAPSDAEEGHLLGPDLTLFLLPPLTIVTLRATPCVSHAFKPLRAIESSMSPHFAKSSKSSPSTTLAASTRSSLVSQSDSLHLIRLFYKILAKVVDTFSGRRNLHVAVSTPQ